MARTRFHSTASEPARTRLHANRGVRVEELREELEPVSTTEQLQKAEKRLETNIGNIDNELPTKAEVGDHVRGLHDDIEQRPTKGELEGHVAGLHDHIDPLPTKEELGAHVAGLHGHIEQLPTKDDLDGRFDPLPTKEELGAHVAGLHGRFDPLPTKEELGAHVAGLHGHIDPLPTKEELGAHVAGLHGRFDPLPTKEELRDHVTGLHGHIDQLPTKAELVPYLERFPTKQDLDTHVADLHKRFDQLPTKDDFKKVAQIIDVIHFILKKWFGIELGELTPEQREKLTHSLRALNRVEALVLDTNLNLEQGNEILNQLSQDTEMQNLLLLLHGLETTGHPTLSDSFRAMLNNRLTSGDIEERTAWLGRIQNLRGAIIQHVAGATGNPPQAESV